MSPPKIAGAPISWGVCEVPGWGYQLSPARVLREMTEVGLSATEFGPDGFLPTRPEAMAATLDAHGLRAVGGFTPLLLHDPDHDPLPEARRLLDNYAASHAGTIVLAAVTGRDGYDVSADGSPGHRPELDDRGWRRLLANLGRIAAVAGEVGVRAVLHPHVGTMVETGPDVQRVLEGSAVALCLDTGHLLVGGTDPAEIARQAPERIAHTHLKDVDAGLAREVRGGRRSYTEAVRAGLYRPLGCGDVDTEAIVRHLTGHGYDGWWVLEQDTVLTEEPTGVGPVADVHTSVTYLSTLLGGRP